MFLSFQMCFFVGTKRLQRLRVCATHPSSGELVYQVPPYLVSVIKWYSSYWKSLCHSMRNTCIGRQKKRRVLTNEVYCNGGFPNRLRQDDETRMRMLAGTVIYLINNYIFNI